MVGIDVVGLSVVGSIVVGCAVVGEYVVGEFVVGLFVVGDDVVGDVVGVAPSQYVCASAAHVLSQYLFLHILIYILYICTTNNII